MEAFSLLTALCVALAGGLGAVCRFGLDTLIQARLRGKPLGIFTVNVIASLGIGALAAVGLAGPTPTLPVGSGGTLTPAILSLVLVSGLLGGFSTFSTVAVDTILLGRARRWGWVLTNSLGMLTASAAAFLAASQALGAILP